VLKTEKTEKQGGVLETSRCSGCDFIALDCTAMLLLLLLLLIVILSKKMQLQQHEINTK
jgi:hypothetical protein